MKPLRFALFGTGFWSRFQLAAWREVPGAQCVALYNRTRSKAEALARDFAVPVVYDDPAALLDRERPDFIDIVTDVDTHARFVHLAAERGIAVISQKPMAPDLATAEQMVATCREAGVTFFVHENWRWQTPIRELKRLLVSGAIGRPFRARIQFSCSFPVFDNQPFLRELDRFILTDIGSHILDTARFLFGEARSLYCQTHRINPSIRGEDVATVIMEMVSSMWRNPPDCGPEPSPCTVVCDMSYASRTEYERFPETFVHVEGDRGSLELSGDYRIHLTDATGTHLRRSPPPRHAWADPAYDLVHASIVPCNRDIFGALARKGLAETTGEDNLRTVRLVFAAYDSVCRGEVVRF